MIARHETHMDRLDIWSKLSAPLPAGVIFWRQDGKPVLRDGRYFARFVAYIEANTVRERLDTVVPGEWDLTLDLLPPVAGDEGEGESECSFKARLQVLGVIREDVGTGRDYKSAATDAFKRVAVRFGVAHELYSYEQNWVQVDSDSRFATPVEDPADAYARRQARAAAGPRASDEPSCPKCGGRMWDNRLSKRNPRAPDFKCRVRGCDGAIWPEKAAANGAASADEPTLPLAQAEPATEADEIPY